MVETGSRSISARVVCILAAWIGAGVSLLLIWQHAHPGAASVCGADSGCTKALQSPYAQILGVPLATLGLAMHASLAAIHLRLYASPRGRGARPLRSMAQAVSLVGTLASGILLYVQVGKLRSICVLCTISAAMVIVIWLAGTRANLEAAERPRPGRLAWLVLGLIGGSLLVASAFILGRQSEIVARFDGTEITASMLRSEMVLTLDDLAEASYERKTTWIRGKFVELALAAEAARRGVTPEALLRSEVEDGLQVSEKDIDDWIRSRRTGLTEEERRARVRRTLLAQRREARRTAFFTRLLAKHETTVLLQPPPATSVSIDTQGAHVEGPADAPVQLVVFSEFQCPFCARLSATLGRIRRRFPEQVAVTFLHFPIQDHAHSEGAAVAVACAGEQGRFQAFHDLLFEDVGRLAPAELLAHAGTLHLDLERFASCRADPGTLARVRSNVRQAQRLGITTVPTLFLNGRRVGGAIPYETLEHLVLEYLQGGWRNLVSGDH